MNVEISTIVDGNIPKYLMIWLILYQSESSPYSLPRRRSPSPRATNRSARCWRKQRNIRRQCLSLLSCGNDDDIYIYICMDRWSSWSRLNMECAEKTSLKWEYGWICYILSTPGLQDDISYLYIHTHIYIYIYIHVHAYGTSICIYIYMYIYIVISCYVYII